MKSALTYLVLPALCLTLTACPPKKSEVHSDPQFRTVVMGDPMMVVKGAQFNRLTNLSYFSNVQSVELFSIVQFVQKASANLSQPVSQETLQKSEAPRETVASGPKTIHFEVSLLKDTFEDKSYQLKNDKLTIVLSNKGDALKGVTSTATIFRNGTEETAEVLHFSQSEDVKKMSILLHTEGKHDQQGESLIALYFAKNAKLVSPPVITPKLEINSYVKFNYLLGPNAKLPWAPYGPIVLNICGADAEGFRSQIKSAVDKWNTGLNSLQKINLFSAKKYFPFSDLSQHCVYYVESFIVNPDPRLAMYGLTFAVPDLENSNILDSDVFLFDGEFQKAARWNSAEVMVEKLKFAIVHELGHFLGLDHQFDPAIPSIMGYDFRIGLDLTAYDLAAIRTLYQQ